MKKEDLSKAYALSNQIDALESAISKQDAAVCEFEQYNKNFIVYADNTKVFIHPALKSELIELIQKSIDHDRDDLAQLKVTFEML